tara:strand:+ start:117 stop:434 length:318 start_codon:yes stop_codon:yes gene_type:complete
MTIKMTTLYDSRNLGEFTDGAPQSVKAEFINDKGITFYGWKYLDDGILHCSGVNHRFFQTSLPNGKKCMRKVSLKIKDQLLELITDHVKSKNVQPDQWYIWKEKV